MRGRKRSSAACRAGAAPGASGARGRRPVGIFFACSERDAASVATYAARIVVVERGCDQRLLYRWLVQPRRRCLVLVVVVVVFIVVVFRHALQNHGNAIFLRPCVVLHRRFFCNTNKRRMVAGDTATGFVASSKAASSALSDNPTRP